jgi:SmpA / OmlA family
LRSGYEALPIPARVLRRMRYHESPHPAKGRVEISKDSGLGCYLFPRTKGAVARIKQRRERHSPGKEVELVRWMTWVLTLIAAFALVFGLHTDTTIYAPGYSWTKFSSIRNGMTPEEVTRILGQPLSIEPFGGTIPRQTNYWYSRLRNIKGEYVMLIHFSEEGRVYQIDANRIGHYCSTPGKLPRPSSLLEWLEWYVL